MKKHVLLLLSLMFTLSLFSTTFAQRTQIQYAFWGLPEEVAVQEQIKEAFEAQHPEYELVLNHISNAPEFASLMLTRIAGGNPPDVMYLGEALAPSFAARGVLTDLIPYVERDNFDLSQYWEKTIQPLITEENQLFAFPKDNTPFMIYYNKNLFDAAGVPHPTIDWTWEDFRSAAEQLTLDTNGDGRIDQWGYAPGLWWAEYISAIYSNGGQVLSEDRTTCLVDEPPAVEALQNISDLMNQEPIVAPSPEALTNLGVGGQDLFNSSRAAMISNGRWGAFFNKPLEAEWGVAPFPHMKEPATVMLFVNLVIPSGASQPDAAWEFIKFMVSDEAQRLNASTGLGLPITKSTTMDGSAWLLPGEPEEHVEIFIDSIQNRARSLPFHPQFAETIDEIAARELDALWRGTASAEEVTATMCPQIEAALSR